MVGSPPVLDSGILQEAHNSNSNNVLGAQQHVNRAADRKGTCGETVHSQDANPECGTSKRSPAPSLPVCTFRQRIQECPEMLKQR